MKKNILVLGSEGMIGRTVFRYLHSLYPATVWGTTRNDKNKAKNIFIFASENYQKDFSRIIKRVKKIDYIINCIGIIDNTQSREELIRTNGLFPHQLEKFVEKNKCKLIHISSDAVFPPLSVGVDESSSVGPVDGYGSSKLLGETTSKNALTFRSSFLGLDPINHKGLLEQVKKSKKSFNGYINQIWTGCTSLQFAEFCESIIKNNMFTKLRKESSVFHFTPLGPVSKYEIVKTFAKLIHNPIAIIKTKGEKRERILKTNYVYLLLLNKYNNNIKNSLQELIAFDS